MKLVFNGKEFAQNEVKRLRDEVIKLEKKLGRKLKLVTMYNPEHEPSRIYTEIKAKMAEELGILFEKFEIPNPKSQINIKSHIQKLNEDQRVDGIIIQMPLFGFRNLDLEIANAIASGKDVDGLRKESGVMPATVRAVLEILNSKFEDPNKFQIPNSKIKILVVGNRGLVGSRLQDELNCEGMDEGDFRPELLKKADIIISATGVAKLINGQMVKDGVVAIDVGYPKGDFDRGVAKKASFFTPVPGGVGPVTVIMLFANLVELVKYKHDA